MHILAEMDTESSTSEVQSPPHQGCRRNNTSRLRSRLLLAVAICLLLAGPGILVTVGDHDFVEAVLQVLPYALMPWGFTLLAQGFKKRVGSERFCARCGYQQPPEGATPTKCPECGIQWNQLGGLRHGRDVRTPWKIWLAIAVLLPFGISLVEIPLRRILPSHFPTKWTTAIRSTHHLIDEVTAPNKQWSYEEWDELKTRTLTADESKTLAEGLLDYRLTREHLEEDAEAWFAMKLKNGEIPKNLAERYYREMLELSLAAPPQAKVGETFTVSVAAVPRTNDYSMTTGAVDLLVYFGGFSLDNSRGPIDRAKHPDRGRYFGPDMQDTPMLTLNADTPGERKIRAVLWVAAIPPSTGPLNPIQWQASGEPKLPASAVWTDCIELEKVVEIVE